MACADVAGAYLHASWMKIIMHVIGVKVDILCKINQTWGQFIELDKKKQKLLFACLKKTLYSCRSALLWYKLFSLTMVVIDFELNLCVPCLVNDFIDGKQFTICWYMAETHGSID